MQRLHLPDDRDRAEAAVQLGRLRATSAVGHLTGLLSNDRSSRVREAAARALGLLGSQDGLPGLQRAALSDDDAEVRKSATNSAEFIRASLPRH
jgi:HEAT repeat protein